MRKTAEFAREHRYIVIKRSDLASVPVNYRSALVDPMLHLLTHLPRREYVVVESDWPEFELVWRLIEARVSGEAGNASDYDTLRTANQRLEGDVVKMRELLTAWRSMFDGGIASGELGVLRGQTDAALAGYEGEENAS